MLSPARYVIGLGANLGDRKATLCAALESLAKLGKVLAKSPLYETKAVGPPQPDFLNAAVLLESALAPRALLTELLAIERAFGRERRERWGPRTLDLDILWSDTWVVNEPDLRIPHPELRRRAFALAPLVDVAPEACDPASQERYEVVLRSQNTGEIHILLGTHDAWLHDPDDPRRSSIR